MKSEEYYNKYKNRVFIYHPYGYGLPPVKVIICGYRNIGEVNANTDCLIGAFMENSTGWKSIFDSDIIVTNKKNSFGYNYFAPVDINKTIINIRII